MSKDELRAALDHFGFSQEGFAVALGFGPRAGQRWASGETEVPGPIAIIVRMLMARPEQIAVLGEIADLSAANRKPRGRPRADKAG